MNITLNELHTLLSESFAVCVNDTLYFVGYTDEDFPYVADNNNENQIDLSEVGDIGIDIETNSVSCYVQGEEVSIKFLNVREIF